MNFIFLVQDRVLKWLSRQEQVETMAIPADVRLNFTTFTQTRDWLLKMDSISVHHILERTSSTGPYDPTQPAQQGGRAYESTTTSDSRVIVIARNTIPVPTRPFLHSTRGLQWEYTPTVPTYMLHLCTPHFLVGNCKRIQIHENEK